MTRNKRTVADDRDSGILDLGTPLHMVGMTGFTRHAGGGRCPECKNVFASLMPDGKCARCSSSCSALGDPKSHIQGVIRKR